MFIYTQDSSGISWPYPVHYGKENRISVDVLIIGGGIAGCHATINAARKGVKVAIVDKGPIVRSGDGGAGVDHWHMACTNPCSKVTPEEMMEHIKEYGEWGYSEFGLGIGAYIQCKAFLVPNPMTPCQAVVFDDTLCTGCNSCVDVCRANVLVPNPEKGQTPICLYPDECWFCGCCVDDCPVSGAIRMEHPLNMRVGWMRKSTGEWFRIGMKNPPAPVTRPAVK